MSLTYDQKSEIRLAFDEAFVPAEQRRDRRIAYRVEADICGWKRNREGEPFRIRIDDFSTGGVKLIHTSKLNAGNQYLLSVPRKNLPALVVLMTVIWCKRQADETFQIGMELSSVMDRTHMGELYDALQAPPRVTSPRLKFMLLLFGIVGLTTTLII